MSVAVYTQFNRSHLRSVHDDVKARWPHIDLRKSVGVTCTKIGGIRHYFVQASAGGTTANWEGRAEDAADARAKAWQNWLDRGAFDAADQL